MDGQATVRRILEAVREGVAPGREACLALLGCPHTSLEAAQTRAVAEALSRRRFGNAGMLLGQLGLEAAPCPGGCGFCVFGDGHAQVTVERLSTAAVLERCSEFTASGDLYALFLMTMHDFDRERLLADVTALRVMVPGSTQLVVNIGDADVGYFRALRAAGVSGAYHVLRLREGRDTRLDPALRRATIAAIKDAGLDWYTCCEPIGPEHSDAELVEQIFVGVEHGCFQHAAMRRVAQPGLPLYASGQISELRLAQVTAVVALASLGSPETRSIAVHEPNVLGLCSGANTVYAETGANPRDTAAETAGHRGLDVAGARQMLWEAGYERLMRGDGPPRVLASLPATAPA